MGLWAPHRFVQGMAEERWSCGVGAEGAKMMSLYSPSRPIWSTFNQAPVLMLGEFQAYKIILVSDSEFADFTAVEVGIDSCWMGSLNCPLYVFSSAVVDAIATESVLFIRQNQLVYYFTGNYSVLSSHVPGSGVWTRVLNNICVSRLNPVHFPHNGSEYVIALGEGVHAGEFFLGTIRDVSKKPFGKILLPLSFSPLSVSCTILWAVYIAEEDMIVLLVKAKKKSFPHLSFADTGKGFVMLLGLEEYTDSPLIPRGLSYNPFSTIFYIWGNLLPHFAHLPGMILTHSFSYISRPFAWANSIWFSVEGSSVVSRLYPSKAWDTYLSLQLMRGSKDFSLNETFVSLFFNKEGLQQLVYITHGQEEGKLIKRNFPLHYILSYQHLIVNQYHSFVHPCSFSVMRFEDLPAPQRFTRMEHYCTEPPDVMDSTGFHNNVSLAVYQGLIFHLLWLHTDYSRPYADPVHDPTWRWWKNRKQYAEYFFYVASNGNASGGVYVNMESYLKIYDLQPNNQLPSKIYLDKNNVYSFSVFLSIRSTKESKENSLDFVWLTIVLAHPKFVVSHLHRHYLVGRGSVLYTVSTRAVSMYFPTSCLSGYAMVPVFIGCPPGKRLAFDITRTLKYTAKQNKRYFDCIHKNPELPCFFFNDVFYPFFLIQDMVTGDSGPFMGSYMLRIIGGGPYSEKRIRYYSQSEILDYNTDNGRRAPPGPMPTLTASFPSCRWVCEENSPCYDVVPLELTAPDYFFLVEVSNRAVDESTYCDYDLEFVIHIHGLRLSPSRAIISMAILTGIVVLYILHQVLGPTIWACFTRLLQRFEEAVGVRTGELLPPAPRLPSWEHSDDLTTPRPLLHC
uniref:Cation channel sperm associated auxiliary subunit gamma n=1 Tax=Chelydra serpentina TaxID=8475 RepID=A0A8C3TE28_CHESE